MEEDRGGERKAKARAILKGYQDPEYEFRATTTPVMTRQTRQLLLQMAVWRRWKVKKGDVSGAFVQGREYRETSTANRAPRSSRPWDYQPRTS